MSGKTATATSDALAEQTALIKIKLASEVTYANYLASVHRNWAVKQYNLIHVDHFCTPEEQAAIWDLARGVEEGTAYSPRGAELLEAHCEYCLAGAAFNKCHDGIIDLWLELRTLDGVLRTISVSYDELVDCATKVEIKPSL